MKPTKQTMNKIRSGGKVIQSANVVSEQVMDDIDAASDVMQLIAVAEKSAAEISLELAKLHERLREHDPDATAELQRVKKAEDAAKLGDGAGIISNLKGVAGRVLDLVKEIGTPIIAKIIEKQLGV